MSQYRAPLDDIRFDLFDVLKVESVLADLGQTEVNRELIDAVLEEGARAGVPGPGWPAGAGVTEVVGQDAVAASR